MPDVDVGHNQVVVADLRGLLFAGGTMDGHVLPDQITIPDADVGALPFELEVLRGASQYGPGAHLALLAKKRILFQDDVRSDPASAANDAMGADHGIGADLDIFADLGGGVNNRG